jgi:hypothetical protein
MKRARLYLVAFALAALMSSEAQAQLMGNAPYQPTFGSGRGGGSFGMSPAYRQAILNAQLLGQQSNPLVRDRNGFLLDVDRRGSQAFLRAPASPFLPASGAAIGISAAGVGFGFGTTAGAGAGLYATAGYGAALDGNRLNWIAMLDASPNEWPWSGVSASATTPAPLNVWIAQLESP